MPTVDVNDITINYRLEHPDSSSGSEDLLVLVNGLADDLATWDLQVSAFLDAGYRILRYDNRGIGKTSRPAGPYTANLLADDLHALLVKTDVKSFHLIGVSMGGMIAQAYALKYPNGRGEGGLKMHSLSLCCTYAEPTTFCSRMFELWADMAKRMSVQDVMRDVTLWAFTVPFFRSRQSELQEVEDAMKQLDMGVDEYLAQLNVIQRFDVTGQLEELRQNEKVLGGLDNPRRVLVLAGKVDILIPVVLSKEIAERIEGSQFVTVKGGHGCFLEFPKESNQALISFLEEHREHKR